MMVASVLCLVLGGQVPLSETTSVDSTPTEVSSSNDSRKPITFDVAFGDKRTNFTGKPAAGFDWFADGNRFLQVHDGQWQIVTAETGKIRPFFDGDAVADILSALPTFSKDEARRLVRGRRMRLNSAKSAAVVNHRNDLYFVRLDGKLVHRLTESPEPEELAEFSPDGTHVAFVRGGNLHVVDVETQREAALTTDGDEVRRNGKMDWVYYEELYHRKWKAYEWSPDSRKIAFLQIDDTPVDDYWLIDATPAVQRPERTRYPLPGRANPNVRLGVVNVDSDAKPVVRWCDLQAYAAADLLISEFGWHPDSRQVYLFAQNREQTWLDVVVADARSGRSRKLLREESPAWIVSPGQPHFLPDGSFLLTSERTGWRHLYHFDANGQLIQALTAGEWEVRDIRHIDATQGWVYLTGTRDSHQEVHGYRVAIDGERIERLTQKIGSHHLVVSPQSNWLIDTYSEFSQPPKIDLLGADGAHVRVLDDNPVPELEMYDAARAEFVQIQARDGRRLDAMLFLPPQWQPQESYPVWITTYGGPHAPSVTNRWRGGNLFERLLAEMGLVVLRVDPRSASGQGAVSAHTAYRQLGVQELRDLEDAVDWLQQLSFVDAERIGLNGHSYGGFLTAYAMTHSELFRAGVAGSPVTDWHLYDSIYTERYMGTPANNPTGYEQTSVIRAADKLHGKLLLLHGGMDDNVHVANSLRLADELQKADKDFELMIYPQSRHGLHGRHYHRLMIDFIRRTMLTP